MATSSSAQHQQQFAGGFFDGGFTDAERELCQFVFLA